MKVSVLGAGGVGGYFGGRLAQAGTEVHFLARGAHLQAIREQGLRVRSTLGDFRVEVPVTDDPAAIGPCDHVLFCVKSYDTEAAAGRLGPLVGEATAVLSLQNGIDNEEGIAAAIGWEHVMGGAAFIFSTIAEPGMIDHSGGPARIVFGEMDGRRTDRSERLLELFDRAAGVDASISSEIRSVLWNKFAFICAHAGMTASVRLSIGEIRGIPESWAMFRRILEEVAAVAEAEGVIIDPQAIDRHLAFARELEASSTSSLHYDLTHGRRMELEALHGTLVRLARDHGIAVPMSEAVHAILKPWAVRNDADG